MQLVVIPLTISHNRGTRATSEFYVFRPEDALCASRMVIVEAGGKTPRERASAAKVKAEPMIRAILAEEGIEV